MEGNNQSLEQRMVLSNKKLYAGLMGTLATVVLSAALLSSQRITTAQTEQQYEFKDASSKATELFKDAPLLPKVEQSDALQTEKEEPQDDQPDALRVLPLLSYRLDNFEPPKNSAAPKSPIPAEPAGKEVSTPPRPQSTDKQEQEQRLLEEALKAPATIKLDFSDTPEDYLSLSAKPKHAATPEVSGENGTLAAYSQFENNSYVNPHEVQSVRAPYVLLQGSLIPAVLLTGINSQLPGQITAQVTTDIYDTLTGEYLLIPSGSRLIGQYASAVEMGMERVFSGFSRLILPDGRSLNLGAMPGQSQNGNAGLEAEVDNHYVRLFVDSFLLAGFATAEALISHNVYDEHGNPRPTALMAQQFESQIGQASTRILERHINLSPTLSVKAGTMFNIAVIKDLYFQGNYEE